MERNQQGHFELDDERYGPELDIGLNGAHVPASAGAMRLALVYAAMNGQSSQWAALAKHLEQSAAEEDRPAQRRRDAELAARILRHFGTAGMVLRGNNVKKELRELDELLRQNRSSQADASVQGAERRA